MSAVRVKICGLTRAADVTVAIEAGADALGFVFAPSKRRLTPAQGARLTALAGDGIMRVGVFMDQDAAEVAAVLRQVELDLLQFHGLEPDAFCHAFGVPYIKAISMQDGSRDVPFGRWPGAAGFLLDSHAPGGQGGTGKPFDWTRPVDCDRPLWLAGGLHPGNVQEAVRALRPWAVDVSSGVEAAPGIKDASLVRQFIERARQA